jgi:PEP-CTERM motif
MHPRRLTGLGVALTIALVAGSSVSADVLTFDDLLQGGGRPIPNGYGGLSWESMWYLDSAIGEGYRNGTVSGSHVAFNPNGDTAIVESEIPFAFTSAYLTGAWRNGLSIEVTGFRGEEQAYARTVVVDSTAATQFFFDYRSIDRLRFFAHGGVNAISGGDGTHFALDNFAFEPVPEPTTLLLLSTSLVAMGVRRHLRKRA